MEDRKKGIHWNLTSWLCPLLLRVRPAELADLLKTFLGIKRQEIETLHGLRLWIDPASHFGQELIQTKVYEPQMTQILLRLLRQGDNFVDVGANEGYFGILAAKKLSTGRVYCIEPQSRLKEVILRNKEENKALNLSIHTLALSDRIGTTEFFLRPTLNTGSSSLFNHTRISGKKETVATTTLQTFVEENAISHIRLLKIDCEGAEDLVILNGKNLFQERKVDFIALEYHHAIRGKEKLDAVHDFLESCGYRLISIRDQSIYYLDLFKNEVENLQLELR